MDTQCRGHAGIDTECVHVIQGWGLFLFAVLQRSTKLIPPSN